MSNKCVYVTEYSKQNKRILVSDVIFIKYLDEIMTMLKTSINVQESESQAIATF